MIKAIIYDLDNTLYPVPSIGEELFGPVFRLIESNGEYSGDIADIKKEMMRTPFRLVAQRYNMSHRLTQEAISLQEEITYNHPISVFDDYNEILKIEAQRFLVTTGFNKMQQSKIDQMGIRGDFVEVHVVDPTKSSKKEVFAGIVARYGYHTKEVLVVGDDPESELKAAIELGIPAVLYNREGQVPRATANYAISRFSELEGICSSM